jgi:SAM-dependent methyltransferase
MSGIQAALDAACPVPASRRTDLSAAVRDLSRMLTTERGSAARSYWRTPRLTAAYLNYFLPWNICRLSQLLPDLDLGLGFGARILDAGSGPLTLPAALWCARPDLRSLPLEFVCADIAPHPLELGRDIFRALAGAGSPWRIRTVRASLERMLFPRRGGSYDLIAALNVLNELHGGRGKREAETLEDDLDGLAAVAAARLKPGGRLLVLEPGTRLGGKIVALLRKGASAHGCRVLAPCTHQAPCPMLRSIHAEENYAAPAYTAARLRASHRNPRAEGGPVMRRPGMEEYASRNAHAEANYAACRGTQAGTTRFSGWCHFSCPADGAPETLRELTRQAGLQKKRLSFSFLLAAKDAEVPPATPGSGKNAGKADTRTELRVLSDPIVVPGENAPARYACSESGLVLLADARHIPSQALVRASARKDAAGRKMFDAKSGLPVYVVSHVPAEYRRQGEKLEGREPIRKMRMTQEEQERIRKQVHKRPNRSTDMSR